MAMPAEVDERTRMAGRVTVGAAGDPLFDLGGAERRMHARAYAHWVSLLNGRRFPSIADIDPVGMAGFERHGVLLDFSANGADPRIVHIGAALQEECRLDEVIARIGQVPARSLLARLTDHHPQIVEHRAPIGFEAEFVGVRGKTTLYRGILMPFTAAEGGDICFVYGVINWKEVADAAVQAALDTELGAAFLAVAGDRGDVPVRADGPHAGGDVAVFPDAPAASLEETLAMARRTAVALRAVDARRRTVLYRALGRAHDLALAADRNPVAWAALAGEAGMAAGACVSMPSVVTLVFGGDHDPAALADFAAVLGHARRHAVAPGRLAGFVEERGGIEAIAAAERQARRRGSKGPAGAPRG